MRNNRRGKVNKEVRRSKSERARERERERERQRERERERERESNLRIGSVYNDYTTAPVIYEVIRRYKDRSSNYSGSTRLRSRQRITETRTMGENLCAWE